MAITPRRPRICEVCSSEYRPSDYRQRACSRLCGAILRGCADRCVLTWHACGCGKVYAKPGAQCPTCRAVRRPAPPSPKPRDCDSCGVRFTPPNLRDWTYCTERCKVRAGRMRRKVREAGSYGNWRWSEFMRIAAKFDYCCAYCGERPAGQLDPDHVIPLAKAGPNTLSNLLPACQSCNGQKTDMLLDQWANYRASRGLSPLKTTWSEDDPRYFHLTALRSVEMVESRRSVA